jgi:hypothetical protein
MNGPLIIQCEGRRRSMLHHGQFLNSPLCPTRQESCGKTFDARVRLKPLGPASGQRKTAFGSEACIRKSGRKHRMSFFLLPRDGLK